ncbi:cytochrome P450 [Paracoccus benzoatiresistens]|uniref:cytochrome P450 n=1 Tax=Paracoccus benzoatiresistens TaxID=2997341 RepID=UPI002E33F204|nr:cytochrome P450 [Paracoccus sp. EF6]
MTTPDPQTGRCFSAPQMVDQVAIFFLAGHETSASALAWALWLLAAHPEWQDAVAAEAAGLTPDMTGISALRTTRAVFREALRLYPPVPMMVREARRPTIMRSRRVSQGAQLVLSPWHLHRHERLWDRPGDFDPGRWSRPEGKASARDAFIPFSAGPRVCPGAGFAMIEGVVMLSRIVQAFHLQPGSTPPLPVARLTVRGRDGIALGLRPREIIRDASPTA